MKKLRLVPIAVSVIVSSSVLFGGWFVYRTVALENPLSEAVGQVKDVSRVDRIEVDGDQAVVRVELDPHADLRSAMDAIRNAAGDREVELDIANEPAEELEQWWAGALFDIAQAMETKRYGDIPGALKKHAEQLAGLRYETQMDDEYVYIRLNWKDQAKFVMLPRVPAQFGAWSHE